VGDGVGAWPPRALRSYAELFALAGLAITQPVLDVFGRAPDFFVYREASRAGLVAFAVLVAVLPAAVLWEAEQLVGLAGARAGRIAHVAFVGLLVGLFLLVSLKQADVASGVLVVLLAAAGATGGVLAYRRWRGIRTWLAYLAAAPFLFVGLFLTTSQASDLLASQEVAAARIADLRDPTTVVILQFDEWPLQTVIDRRGRIDPDLYPNLAALAADGVWYRNATTAATYTTYAVPAILTGRQPDGERAAVASEYPESLFTLLGGEFDLDVIESVTQLCPTNLCDGDLVDQGPGSSAGSASPHGVGQLLIDATETYRAMASPDPDAAAPAATFGDAIVTAEAESAAEAAAEAASEVPTENRIAPPVLSLQSVDDLVASIEEGERPTLHFLHLLLPHTPYQFLPDGRRYAEDSGGLSAPLPRTVSGRSEEPAASAFDEQRLLLQAAYTDTVVGRVTDQLRAAGLYDDAIVVVAADHGIGLEPGGAVRAPVGDELPTENYADLLYVPLVIKAPGLGPPGTVSDANVSTVDIVPTIAAALGIDPPWSVDGIDLAHDTRPDGEKVTHVVSLGDPGGVGGGLSLGDPLRFDGEAVLAEVLDRHVDTLLRDDNPDHRLYDIDDAGEIVGERADELAIVGEADATVELADVGAFLDVDLSSGHVPTHLVADLGASTPDDLTVAVAVNGTVAAVSPTWASGDQPHHLEAMLLPDPFEDGANLVEIYLVGGTEGARTLAPVPFG
jgi:Sulfatase